MLSFLPKAKAPKLTELHNEVSSLRERLADAVKINDYLRKQIEIYHITHNNTESLLEMAQRLNLTKDELDSYKEKLAKIEDLNSSLFIPTNNQQPVVVNNSHNNYSRVPSRERSLPPSPGAANKTPPRPSHFANNANNFNSQQLHVLENELMSWKTKYTNLKVLLHNNLLF